MEFSASILHYEMGTIGVNTLLIAHSRQWTELRVNKKKSTAVANESDDRIIYRLVIMYEFIKWNVEKKNCVRIVKRLLHSVGIVSMGANVVHCKKFRDKNICHRRRNSAARIYGCSVFAHIVYSFARMWLSPFRVSHTVIWSQCAQPNLSSVLVIRSNTRFYFVLVFRLHSKRKSKSINMFGGQQILVLSKSAVASIAAYFQFDLLKISHRQ